MSKQNTTVFRQGVFDSTFPKLLLRNYRQWGDKRLAIRKKERGIWKTFTWADCFEEVKSAFQGLLALGLAPEDRVAILGDSSPEWFWSELAVQAAQGTVVALNPASSPEKIQQVLELAHPRFVIAQDQEQVDKLLETPFAQSLEKIVYWREKGLNKYDQPNLVSFRQLIEQREANLASDSKQFQENLVFGEGSEVAIILYAASESDSPIEIQATHNLLLSSAEAVLAMDGFHENHEYMSVMSPGWFFEQVIGFGICLLAGRRINFAEDVGTAQTDFREISPHVVVYPAHLWEILADSIKQNLAASGSVKRGSINGLLRLGYAVERIQAAGKNPNIVLKMLYRMADLIGFRALRDKHGLDRVKVAYSAGGTLSPETLQLFSVIGISIKQIYGSIENGIVPVDPGENRIERQYG
ncbi:MAG: AMP-binding protein [Dehalococcoidia bacterium]